MGWDILFDGAAEDNALLRVGGPQIVTWDFRFLCKACEIGLICG